MDVQINKAASLTIIIFLCLVSYWNSLGCDLVHDDVYAIKENADLRPETSWKNLLTNDFWGKSMTDNTSHKSYRPLTVLTFRVNYFLHGLDPFGYHFVNLVLHTFVSTLFYTFCNNNIFLDQTMSLATAAVFACHPVHTEAVTGVVGRADLLSCLLFLSSLFFYLRVVKFSIHTTSYQVNNNNKQLYEKNQSWSHFLASIILASLAMLCKENGITAIGVFIVLDISFHLAEIQSFIFNSLSSEKLESLKRLFVRIVLLALMALALLAFRLRIMNAQLPAFNEEDNPASFAPRLGTRFMTYCYLCVFNIWLLLCPHRLSYDWQIGSIPLVESVGDIRNIYSVLLFIGLAALVLVALWSNYDAASRRTTLIGVALLVIPFLPASNLFIRVGFVVAERILYIPSLGYCVLVGHGLSILSNWKTATVDGNQTDLNASAEHDNNEKCHSGYRRLLAAALVSLVVLFMLRTINRNKVWKNRETLFRSGVAVIPHNAKVHYNYANFLKDSNRTDEAIYHYKVAEAEYHFKQTLLNNPYHYKAMYNLACLFRSKKQYLEAKDLLENSLRVNPEYLDAIQVLAETFHDLGETKRGLQIFHKASLKTADPNFFNNYGVFLANTGDVEGSLHAYEKAIELQPLQKLFLVNYGRQLKAVKRYEDAENVYRRALRLGRDANTVHLLGILLYQMRRLKESELAFFEALKYEPRNEDYIKNHATAVFEQGQQEEAITLLRDSLKLLPNSSAIVKVLASFLMNRKRPKEALEAVTYGLAYNMNDPELHYMRANAFRELNSFNLALESFKDVLKLDPNNFSALQNIGVIYHLQGLKVEARHYYSKALALHPDNKVLRDNMAKLLRTM